MMEAADRAQELDRKWFAKNPKRFIYLRPSLADEHEVPALADTTDAELFNATTAEWTLTTAANNATLRGLQESAMMRGDKEYTAVIQVCVGQRLRCPVFLSPVSRQVRRNAGDMQTIALVMHQLPAPALLVVEQCMNLGAAGLAAKWGQAIKESAKTKV